jgi:Protein of unknown function (DUF2637)
VASYEHAYTLVRAHGEIGWTGRLVPLTVDGLIYASSMGMLDSAHRKTPVPALARWLLGLGIAAALAANVAHGLGHGPVGAAVAAWPAVTLEAAAGESTSYSQPRRALSERARRIHLMLGQVQERMLPLLHAAGATGMTTGDIARALGYDQANAGLTLKAMARQGLVVRDTSDYPNRWRLVPELLDAAADAAEGD